MGGADAPPTPMGGNPPNLYVYTQQQGESYEKARNNYYIAQSPDYRLVLAAVPHLLRLVELDASIYGCGFLCGAGGSYR